MQLNPLAFGRPGQPRCRPYDRVPVDALPRPRYRLHRAPGCALTGPARSVPADPSVHTAALANRAHRSLRIHGSRRRGAGGACAGKGSADSGGAPGADRRPRRVRHRVLLRVESSPTETDIEPDIPVKQSDAPRGRFRRRPDKPAATHRASKPTTNESTDGTAANCSPSRAGFSAGTEPGPSIPAEMPRAALVAAWEASPTFRRLVDVDQLHSAPVEQLAMAVERDYLASVTGIRNPHHIWAWAVKPARPDRRRPGLARRLRHPVLGRAARSQSRRVVHDVRHIGEGVGPIAQPAPDRPGGQGGSCSGGRGGAAGGGSCGRAGSRGRADGARCRGRRQRPRGLSLSLDQRPLPACRQVPSRGSLEELVEPGRGDRHRRRSTADSGQRQGNAGPPVPELRRRLSDCGPGHWLRGSGFQRRSGGPMNADALARRRGPWGRGLRPSLPLSGFHPAASLRSCSRLPAKPLLPFHPTGRPAPGSMFTNMLRLQQEDWMVDSSKLRDCTATERR